MTTNSCRGPLNTTPGPLIRVIAAVVSRGDELLVCQRPLEKRHGGLWEFPGGKCEPGESDAAAARRELYEELGVEVAEIGEAEFTIADPGSPFLIVFVPVRIAGEPRCHEHIALKWGRLSDLAGLHLAPSDRRFVEFRCEGRLR
jgi:mutator protein MutT